MAGEPKTAVTLQNILDEACVLTAAENRFFSELEALLAGTLWPPDAAPAIQGKAAEDLAILAVTQVAPALYFQGPALNGQAGFSKLARLRTAKKYYKYLPPREGTLFLDNILKSDNEFESASAAEIRQWIEDHLRTYSGSFNLAPLTEVAWATESDRLHPPPTFAEAIDVLGLPHLRTHPAGVLFRYERARVPQQHLPRSLDALGFPPFAMERDCTRPHGTTRRTSNGAAGLPEVVHGGCNLNRTEFINLEVLT